MLSPRGQVLERGMPRFFRRLAGGVFDQEDLSSAGAEVTTRWYPGGDALSPQEIRDAAAWYQARF